MGPWPQLGGAGRAFSWTVDVGILKTPAQPSRWEIPMPNLRSAWRALAALLLACAPWPAQAAVNGLWLTSGGDYEMVLQDGSSGTTLALQVPADFKNVRVWMGTGSATAINLQGLTAPSDTLVASVGSDSMSGKLTVGGQQQPFSAHLALAWVATEQAGVWRKSGTGNAYLVFAVLNTGSGNLAVQIDVTLNADQTVASAVYTGTLNAGTFNGLALSGSGQLSRLVFSGGTLQGTLTTPGRPPQAATYSATQVIAIQP